MKKENVLELLKSINYPGFSRDIVSFGMIKDINIDGDSVTVQMNITSQNEEKKQEVIKWDPLESTCRHASLSIL